MRTKKKIEIVIISLLITSQFIPLISQTATKLSILDTRNVNTGPNGFSYEIKAEFKQRSIIGVPGTGTYSGLLTIAPWQDNSGNKHHQLNFNDGGIFYRTGWPSETTWGTWSRLVLEDANGRVGIGTSTPDEMLTVNGKIHAKEVIVALTGPLADYVFEPDYCLKPLHEVEQFVRTNKHLPGIPSAAQVEEKGLSIGEMQNKLLQKIEELTLYMIDQGKTINQQSAKIKELEEKLR